MKIFCILISILLFFVNTFSQPLKGTLIIAAIGMDGIMIAADSRLSFKPKDIQLAYSDSLQKISYLNNSIVTFTGYSLVGDEFVIKSFKDFNKLYAKPLRVTDLSILYIDYLKRQYSPEKLILIKDNQFIFAGYLNDSACICINDISGINNSCIPFKAIDISDKAAAKYFKYDYVSASKAPVKTLAIAAEKAIKQYAHDFNKENEIGGPISIIFIKPNNKIQWYKNDFTNKYYPYFKDFAQAYLTNKIKFHFLTPDGKKIIDKMMKDETIK